VEFQDFCALFSIRASFLNNFAWNLSFLFVFLTMKLEPYCPAGRNKIAMLRRLNAVLVLMTTSSSPFSTATLFVATSAWQTVSKEFFRMKKTFVCALLTLALACCGTALYAQQDTMSQGGPQAGEHRMPPSADQRLAHMTKMLNLTPDQQAKIKPILENQQSQMESLHQDQSMSREDRMAKAQQIRQSSNTEIQQILTPDQQQKWTSMQGQRQGGGGRGPASGGATTPQ
jgi:Spy/CpxP family protein refolding chaperone